MEEDLDGVRTTIERVGETRLQLEEQKKYQDAFLAMNKMKIKHQSMSKFLDADIPQATNRLKLQEDDYLKKMALLENEMKNELMDHIASLKPGQTFGELALRIDHSNPDKVVRRAATITCTKNSSFAVIDKSNYREVLDKIE
jgi:hypothetical protein